MKTLTYKNILREIGKQKMSGQLSDELSDMFICLLSEHEYVFDEINRISQMTHKPFIECLNTRCVAVLYIDDFCVRMNEQTNTMFINHIISSIGTSITLNEHFKKVFYEYIGYLDTKLSFEKL